MDRTFADVRNLAVHAATDAGDLQIAKRSKLHVQGTKAHANDFVTDLDIASEALIRSRISATFPDDAIVGEENGSTSGTSAWRWCIDPIDGTRSFLTATGPWSVSIAASHNGDDIVGVVHDPLLHETFTAIKDEGVHLNDAPVDRPATTELHTALLGLSFNPSPHTKRRMSGILGNVLPEVGDIRRLSAALMLAYVATGRLQCGLMLNVKRWDVAAGLVLVGEAGLTMDVAECVDDTHEYVTVGNVEAVSFLRDAVSASQ